MQSNKSRMGILTGAALIGAALLSGCGSPPPPQTISTTTEETTTAPAPMPAPVMPGTPGTTTTTTTHAVSTPGY